MKISVYHREYGCDTGCCGHVIYVDYHYRTFTFDHPYSKDAVKWAQDLIRSELGEEHVKDLDWGDCVIEEW